MDQADIEGLATWAIEQIQSTGDEPMDPVLLACELVGAPVRRIYGMGAAAALTWTSEGYIILVRGGLPPEAQRFAVAHECAEWLLFEARYAGEYAEEIADGLAAALLAPRRAIQRALALGLDRVELAEAFGVTESCMVLRIAEVTGRPVALVSPSSVRVRGDDWAWPQESELRRWAAVGGPGIVRARLRDDPRRVAVGATR